MFSKDSIGDRMKSYENEQRKYLVHKEPVIMRLDGKAFHTFTRKYCKKPFDSTMNYALIETTKELMKNISGSKFAYTQSDEISILITDFDKEETQPWFNYNIQKMVSISAAIASLIFSETFSNITNGEEYGELKKGFFDCRVFNIPKHDIANYFIWRQRDWERNSVSMLARYFYSQKALNEKNIDEQKEMIKEIFKDNKTDKINYIKDYFIPIYIISEDKKIKGWDDLFTQWKYGTIINSKTFEEDYDIERFEYEKFCKKYLNFI